MKRSQSTARRHLLRVLALENSGRDPERLAIKYRKMRQSAFAFTRASPALFYDQVRLPHVLARAPSIWICGDLHLENFGVVRGANGLPYFDINDFDHAALALCSWDIVRLLTSVDLTLDRVDVSPAERRRCAETFLTRYSAALATGKALWLERRLASSAVQQLLKRGERNAADPIRERTRKDHKGRRRIVADGEDALPLKPGDLRQVQAVLRRVNRLGVVDRLRLVDAARRVSGLASLGLTRFVALVARATEKRDLAVVDIKIARPSLVPNSKHQKRWKREAERVVAIETALQAVPPGVLVAASLGTESFVVRDLQPRQEKITAKSVVGSRREFRALLRELGDLVAWAHLRGAERWGADSTEALVRFGSRTDWQRAAVKTAFGAALKTRKSYLEFKADVPVKFLG